MIFTGQVSPAFAVGPTDRRRDPKREWIATCPLWITDESGHHREVKARDFVIDLFGFSSASDAELVAVGHRFARSGDLVELDSITTGSGVLVVRQPRRVTIVTDLAGVWPVFYARYAADRSAGAWVCASRRSLRTLGSRSPGIRSASSGPSSPTCPFSPSTLPPGGQVPLITEAAAALDYDSYVQQPDGSLLTQSSARDTVVHMCRMLELGPGLRVLEVGTGSGYTSALLGRIVGEQGNVVSLDVNSNLTERARIKHAQNGVGNVAVHTTDGYAGWAAGAPYDRIIGWAAPHLLPRAWVEEAADQAVIVTPVKVAPIAQAHLLLRVDVHHGRAIPRDVHAGGFIEMYSEVITEVAVPIRHRDALHPLDGRAAVWVSAPTMRDNPELARHAAQMIAEGHSVASPFDDDPARGAFSGYLYARQPHGLASAGFGGVGPGSASGIGLVLTDSAAVLRPRDMYVAGTGEAEESLRTLIKEWTRAGRPDHTALKPILNPGSEGFRVEVTT